MTTTERLEQRDPDTGSEGARAPSVAGTSLVFGRYRPGLDGLRGIAMVFMLGYHAQLPFTKGAFLGLSQFFTLSGFLITGVLLGRRERSGISLRDFWSRRFRRLMPAALLCLAGVAVFGATVATRQQAEELPGGVAAAATYTANWFFIHSGKSYVDLFAAPSPVQHYWSLAVEEQFYLFMPIVMVVIFRFTRSARVLGGIIGGLALASTAWMIYLYRTGTGLDRLYYGTDTRIAEILVGVLLAVVLYHVPSVSRRLLLVLGTIGLVAYIISLWAFMTVPLTYGPIWQGGFLAFSLMSCAVIAGVVSERGPLALMLSWGPLPALGRYTYGLYLYHWPIFLWLTAERTGLSIWPLFAVRVALTLVLAAASYHLIEQPILAGTAGTKGRRVFPVMAPAAAALIVVAVFLTVDTSGPDPSATFRSAAGARRPPVVAGNGVLDLLVITDGPGEAVADRISALAAQDPKVDVVRAPAFRCTAIEATPRGPNCRNWADTWPKLIADHNPDLVLLYLDDWPVDDLTALSGQRPAELPAFAAKVLGTGFDELTARGAPILWAQSGTNLVGGLTRENLPLALAMGELERSRTDVRRVLGGRLPDAAATPKEQFLDESARALIADSALYQRAEDSSLPRMMVIGDSQARSLGYGLEQWAVKRKRAVVWNVATEGCGLADQGEIKAFDGRAGPIPTRCREAVAALSDQVSSFKPDVVIVLSSVWDTQDRAMPDWKGLRGGGDPAVDAYLRRAYDKVFNTMTARGASLVWMNAPCSKFTPVPGQSTELPDSFDPKRAKALNREVLAPLAAAHPDKMSLFDLDAALCPGGQYTNRIDGVDGIRSDGIHFSVNGAIWFADTYGDKILKEGLR